TLLLAGHETTATALAWTVERVLADGATHARLRDELAAGRTDFADAVIKETLRLRPIVPMVARVVKAPFSIAGYTLPAGATVGCTISLAHRRAEAYPEPTRFLPERFLGKKVAPYTWLPFGGGIRRCLGMAFALYEMRIVLATILGGARLALAPGPPVGVI